MSSKSLQELINRPEYEYIVCKGNQRIKKFSSYAEATRFADGYSLIKQKPQVNPNIIVPADVYEIRIIDADTKKTVSKEIYTANIRIRK